MTFSKTGHVHGEALTYQQGGEAITITVGTSAWFAWLEDATSFLFQHEQGRFTAHKTQAGNRRGSSYWRATRRSHGKLYSFYLGASTRLTLSRLQEAAHELVIRAGATGEPPPTHLLPQPTFDASADPLLSIKLHIPRLPVQHVSRPRLLTQLEQDAQRPLTLISAPAGSGKTTLLAEWASMTSMPVAWLSLEATENDPARFLIYLVATLARLDERIDSASQRYRGAPWEQIMSHLLNDLTGWLQSDAVVILDDFHLLTSETVRTMLNFLLEHLPIHLHLVIGTRVDPPLPLARLRARNQVSERHIEELCFASDEVATFARVMGYALSNEATGLLQRRTEGWIAGVQLLLLALRGHADATAFLKATGGAQRFLLDYFSEEILSQQPPALQRFLLHTCVLERLSGPLCDAVTEENNGQDQLRAALRTNLFLSELDDTQTWYRYHPLFAESLRIHLLKQEPALLPELYQRASYWYEQQHWDEEACEYAFLAGDYPRAASLLERLTPLLMSQGKFLRVQQWFSQLPPDSIASSPLLYLTSLIWAQAQRRSLIENPEQAVKKLIEHLEEQIRAHAQDIGSSWVDLQPALPLLQALTALSQGNITHMISLIEDATPVASQPDSSLSQLIATGRQMLLGTAYGASGNLAAAEQIFIDTSTSNTMRITFPFNLSATLSLIELYEAQGKLHKLERRYDALFQALDRDTLPLLQAQVLVRYGVLLYERNQLQEAEATTQQALEISLHLDSSIPGIFLFGDGTLIRIALAQGRDEEARKLLEHMEHNLAQWQAPVANLIIAIPARLALTCGLLEPVERWEAQRKIHFDDPLLPHFQGKDYFDYITLARLLLTRGRNQHAHAPLSQALALLERWHDTATNREAHGWNFEIQMLRALVLQAQGKIKRALHILGQTLAQAEPEGYVRLFADEGQPMLLLLAQVSAHTTASPHYLQQLRDAITPIIPSTQKPGEHQQPLLDPLTPREQEVLALLAEGFSNQQVAERLVISPNTAKRHIKHLFAKLAVTNRTQAVVRARDLHLL